MTKRRQVVTGPFAGAAHDLRSRGLVAIPVDGKVPLVTWGSWRRAPGRAFLDKLIARHPRANVGVLCGLSRLTVVDVDDPALVEPMTLRCGPTPLAIATPNGGRHLWYKWAGERCADLRDREGLAVDVKADGGFVVVPPSSAPNGAVYSFAVGSWADLPHLPTVKAGSLPVRGYNSHTLSLRAIEVGRRNDTLFRLLLRQAGACDAESDLLDVAETIAADHFELDPRHPFTPAEIRKTVASVWWYEQTGRNWTGKEARAVTTATELALLQRNPDALALRLVLQCAHGARPEPFAVSAKALAAGEFIAGWTDFKRYARARDWLVKHGFLTLAHAGGRGAGDPHLYRLTTPAAVACQKGTPDVPNITVHPSPGALGPDALSFVGKRARG
jgi:Bifunctional DNA primase/polymerase, N-terminal/Primase C terminal 1 (PriCT-1)